MLRNRINFTIMTVVGLMIAGFGFYLRADYIAFEDNAVPVEGTVSEFLLTNDGLYTPVFLFKDENGNDRRHVSSASSRPPAYEENEPVTLLVSGMSGGAEFRVEVPGGFSEFVHKLGLILFGLLFVVLGLVFGAIFWNRQSNSISWSREINLSSRDSG